MIFSNFCSGEIDKQYKLPTTEYNYIIRIQAAVAA
jgi:hypothetical protein